MSEAKLYELLEKYNKGECSKSEEKIVTDYFDFLQKSDKWNETLYGKRSEIGLKIYKNIKVGLKSFEKKKTSFFKWSRVAAVLLIMLGAYLGFSELKKYQVSEEQIEYLIKSTRPGQKKTIKLSDGTSITLNSESTLKIPKVFAENKREVELTGEAYFNVTTNPEKPFIVKSGQLITKVFGTKFNVNAFPEDIFTQVSLIEGTIKVEIENHNEVYQVKPSQQIIFDKTRNKTYMKKFSEIQVAGWKDNLFVFRNEPLKEVLKKVSRAYGVKLEVKDKKDNKRKVTTELRNVSITNVAELLKFSTRLRYETILENNRIKRIVFYK